MSVSVPQNSFVGGEWAPSLYGRSDLQKWATSVRKMKNFYPHPHGGASNRGGTEFIASTKDPLKRSRLVPFQFSTVQSYVLEFGHLYMRVLRDGGLVGDEDDLHVVAGQTVTIYPGQVRDYNSITVDAGGVLEIASGLDFAYIGVKTNLVNNGIIRAVYADSPTAATVTRKAPDAAGNVGTTGETLSWSYTVAPGGNGGASTYPASGGTTLYGNGGGGATDQNGIAPSTTGGAPGAAGLGDYGGAGGQGALGYGLDGHTGAIGGTESDIEGNIIAAYFSGGGGGGKRGKSGGGLYLKVKGNVSGSGYFYLNGGNGGKGGAAGAGISVDSYLLASGGGGGGAGGCGGRLYIRYGGSYSFNNSNIIVSGGTGGVGGAGSTGSYNGGSGSSGAAGSYNIASYTPVAGQWPFGSDVFGAYELATPYTEDDLSLLKFVQSADVLYVTHPSYAPRKIARFSHSKWSISEITFGPQIAAPTNLTIAGGSGAKYVVTAVGIDGEESIASNVVTGAANNALNWNAVAGADYYNVYKDTKNSGVFGWIGQANSTTFTEPTATITPDYDKTPPKARVPFDGPGNYPGCSTFFEQRWVAARTDNEPQSFWGSITGSFENMNVSSPLQDDDAYKFTIPARQVNEVRWLVPLNELIIGTSGGEWKAGPGGSAVGVITPTNISLRPQSQWGVSDVQPLVIGNSVLFIEASGSVVRDLMYSLEADGYRGNDLSLLANHLFKNYEITDWCYQQHPDSIVWCVRSDGVLLGLTYYKEQDVWGWHRHETDGAFESVACIRTSAGVDEVYAIVRREIGGQTVRYIERFMPRLPVNASFEPTIENAFFVDSGLVYEGAPEDTFGGLSHLEGKEVVALADGNVAKNLTVIGGTITIPKAASRVVIGLPYECLIETHDFDYQTENGSVQDKIRDVHSVVVKLENTRQLFAGPEDDADKLTELQLRAGENYGEPTAMFSGDQEIYLESNAGRRGRLVLKVTDPVPATILSVTARVDHGEA